MKRVRASDFPELRRVFTGYMHEDFLEEYETPTGALRAFVEDANRAERQRFHREARRLLDATAALDFPDVLSLLARLGCRWTPPSREALVAWLSDATASS